LLLVVVLAPDSLSANEPESLSAKEDIVRRVVKNPTLAGKPKLFFVNVI
jgi:hypothetical protein